MKLTNLKSLILGLCILAASTVKAQLFDYKNPVPYKASATVKKINNVGVYPNLKAAASWLNSEFSGGAVIGDPLMIEPVDCRV